MPQQIQLPKILAPSGLLLEEAIKLRRSKRSGYKSKISLEELSRLLFAAQGITSNKKRAVASAGAAYPLELFVVAKNVEKLDAGLYRYDPLSHSIERLEDGDFQPRVEKSRANEVKRNDFTKCLETACGKYAFVKGAPVSIIIAADFQRTTARYGGRGIMYVHMEAGSACQNISLEAVNLGLGTVIIGAFDAGLLRQSLNLAFEPLCILPVG